MSTELNHASLQQLLTSNGWQDIVLLTGNMSAAESTNPGFWFFRAMAFIELHQPEAAVNAAEHGLAVNPGSHWGNRVLFDAMLAAGKLGDAFRLYKRFIGESKDVEAAKAWYVERAAELDLFDIADEMNSTREVIIGVPSEPKYALGVQCFCKADTLEAVFSSLCELVDSERYGLVILQDSPEGAADPGKYLAGTKRVQEVMARWQQQLSSKFFSVEALHNRRNLGTAPSCRRLLDHIAARFDGFLFLEDDCVLAPSALEWTTYHLENTVTLSGAWFVTCESSYFDQEDRHLDEQLKDRLVALTSLESFRDCYILNDFVNSTCFATRSDIWKRCAGPRSFTRGPESLSRFINMHGVRTIAPTVPRAADIGMMHELGYSAGRVGIANVREKKRVYALAQNQFLSTRCREVGADRDLIYRATCEFDTHAIDDLEQKYGSSSPTATGPAAEEPPANGSEA